MQQIYTEYSRMRENGMDAKSVLSALRPRIEALSRPEREALAGQLRAWEARPAANPPAGIDTVKIPPLNSLGSIKPLRAAAPSPEPAAVTDAQAESVICAHCGKSNKAHEVFCYACGQVLDSGRGMNDTRHFNSGDSAPLDSEYFGPDSVLGLRVRGSTDPYEIRPQRADYETIIGRSTSSSAMAPDIDLQDKQGADLGVSRLHLSIRYDAEHHVMLVSDLGSANGSFINGQRLLAKEIRVLRHGDELRLGKLVMIVSFRHSSATQ